MFANQQTGINLALDVIMLSSNRLSFNDDTSYMRTYIHLKDQYELRSDTGNTGRHVNHAHYTCYCFAVVSLVMLKCGMRHR